MMNGHGKSDSPIVPTKSPNKAAPAVAEGVEGRGLAKGNSRGQNALRTQGRGSAQSAPERVRKAGLLAERCIPVLYLGHLFFPRGLGVGPEAGAV